MKLYVKQQVFSIKERFYVKDSQENNVYYVIGSFFKIPKQFEIYNLDDELVLKVERVLFRWLSEYKIELFNETLTFKKQLTFIKPRFTLDKKGWEIQGDFLARNYIVKKDNEEIFSVNKHWFTWGDSYEIDILNKEDALLALAIVIIIDAELAGSSANVTVSTN